MGDDRFLLGKARICLGVGGHYPLAGVEHGADDRAAELHVLLLEGFLLHITPHPDDNLVAFPLHQHEETALCACQPDDGVHHLVEDFVQVQRGA